MKKIIVISFFLFFSCFLFAIGEISLVPREFFVGDKVELSFFVDKVFSNLQGNNKKADIDIESLISDENKYKIESVVLISDGQGTRVSFKFIPWISGTVQFAPFEYEGVLIEVPQVRVMSILEKIGRSEIEAMRTPMLLPGTMWTLYAALFLFVVLVLFLVIIMKKFVLYFSKGLGHRRALRIVKKRKRFVKKQAKVLEKKIPALEKTEWFVLFNIFIKSYLSLFCKLKNNSFIAHTTKEILNEFLICEFDGVENLASDLLKICKTSDGERFSKKEIFRKVDLQKSCLDDFLIFVEKAEASEFLPMYLIEGEA